MYCDRHRLRLSTAKAFIRGPAEIETADFLSPKGNRDSAIHTLANGFLASANRRIQENEWQLLNDFVKASSLVTAWFRRLANREVLCLQRRESQTACDSLAYLAPQLGRWDKLDE